ncbi:MAG: hypothetical protein KIT84_01800 [Labilithrix sp.]|nr:hypothetical protein [Labilithrix sp.]MCW5809721.1 hypothetical protein [Labilithrix sp.]
MAVRNCALFSSAVLVMMAVGCSDTKDDSATSELAVVNDITCNIARGAFVARSETNADGELSVSCPGTFNVLFNGQPIQGQSQSFSVKPKEGVNLIHVETVDAKGVTKANEVSFLFGTFADPRLVTNKAVSVRIGANGMSAPGLPVLPLPVGPTNVTLSQIGTQVLRDQGNLLARLDGMGKDVSGAGFGASITLDRSSYNPKSATIRLSAREGGLRLEAIITNVESTMTWRAWAPFGIEASDQLYTSVDRIRVVADVNVRFDAATKSLVATLGATETKVEGVDLDDTGLGNIPLIGDHLEDAVAAGAEWLINRFADPLVAMVKDQVLPDLSFSLNQFRLPERVDVPFLGGQVELKQDLDGAAFKSVGSELSLAAAVLAPANAKKTLSAPGWLTHPASAPTWETDKQFGASLSVDYVNQALFSVWRQGLLNRQLIDHVEMLGIKTDAIVLDAKLPPVLLAAEDGSGVNINLGELQLDTVYHAQAGGQARVRLAVSLVTKAKLSIENGGEFLKILPAGDETATQLSARLIGVEEGKQAAADELSGMLDLFTPYLQTLISNDIDLPPIAIPGVDLGIISPAFAGREGRFDGAIQFDPNASRVLVQGNLVAR